MFERFVFILLSGLGIYSLAEGFSIDNQSGYFQIALGLLLIVLCCAGAIIAFIRKSENNNNMKVLFSGLLLFLGYLILSGIFGILSSALLFTPVMAFLGGERGLLRLSLVTLLFTAFIYVTFALIFRIPFPSDLLLED